MRRGEQQDTACHDVLSTIVWLLHTCNGHEQEVRNAIAGSMDAPSMSISWGACGAAPFGASAASSSVGGCRLAAAAASMRAA